MAPHACPCATCAAVLALPRGSAVLAVAPDGRGRFVEVADFAPGRRNITPLDLAVAMRWGPLPERFAQEAAPQRGEFTAAGGGVGGHRSTMGAVDGTRESAR